MSSGEGISRINIKNGSTPVFTRRQEARRRGRGNLGWAAVDAGRSLAEIGWEKKP